MTDHPRFDPIRSAPDEAHLDYNGGRLVDIVLRLVDRWLGARARGREGDANKSKSKRGEACARSWISCERRGAPAAQQWFAQLTEEYDMTTLDSAKLDEISDKAIGYLSGAAISALVYLGDQLGLYRTLREAGRVTSAELAARSRLHERWVREWLHGQASAGLVRHATTYRRLEEQYDDLQNRWIAGAMARFGRF